MSLNNTIKWGIIGCGNVTELKSGPGYNKTNFCKQFNDYDLIPSDSAILATSTNQNLLFFKRNDIIRIPIGEEINKWLKNI